MLLLVDRRWIEYSLGGFDEAAWRDLAVEAASMARVAGGVADLLYFEQDGVAVAIDVDALDDLDVTAFFALSPQAAAASAVIDRAASGFCFGESFGVHVRDHQDFARRGVLSDGGKQAIAVRKVGGNNWIAQGKAQVCVR